VQDLAGSMSASGFSASPWWAARKRSTPRAMEASSQSISIAVMSPSRRRRSRTTARRVGIGPCSVSVVSIARSAPERDTTLLKVTFGGFDVGRFGAQFRARAAGAPHRGEEAPLRRFRLLAVLAMHGQRQGAPLAGGEVELESARDSVSRVGAGAKTSRVVRGTPSSEPYTKATSLAPRISHLTSPRCSRW